jgi:hypothetical protein
MWIRIDRWHSIQFFRLQTYILNSIPDEDIENFICYTRSRRNVAPVLTQPPTENCTKNLPACKGLLMRKADIPAAISEQIVHIKWEPRRRTNLRPPRRLTGIVLPVYISHMYSTSCIYGSLHTIHVQTEHRAKFRRWLASACCIYTSTLR